MFYEFLRVTTHPRVLANPWPVNHAWNFLDSILEAPSVPILSPSPRHSVVAEATFQEMPVLRGNIIHDAHTAILLREHGIKSIYTFDANFHRFKFTQVTDPSTD